MRSSRSSFHCRLEWRPSRLLIASLLLLGLLAAWSLWHSALPRPFAIAAVVLALAEGARLARREWRRPIFELCLHAGADTAQLNFTAHQESVSAVRLNFRGPLARLSGRDHAGRIRHWQWWPDTLPPAARRQLRLAATAS